MVNYDYSSDDFYELMFLWLTVVMINYDQH